MRSLTSLLFAIVVCGSAIVFGEDGGTVSFSTYYPAPIGVYRELRAKHVSAITFPTAYSWSGNGTILSNETALFLDGGAMVVGDLNWQYMQYYDLNVDANAIMGKKAALEIDGIGQDGGNPAAHLIFAYNGAGSRQKSAGLDYRLDASGQDAIVFSTHNGTTFSERARLTETANLGLNSASPYTDTSHTTGNLDVNDVYVRAADANNDGVAEGAWLSTLVGGGRPVEVYRFTQTAAGAGSSTGTLARIARPALLVGHKDGASGTVSWANTPFSSSDLPDIVVRCSSSPSSVYGYMVDNASFKYKLVPANEKSVNFVVIGPSET